MRALLSSFFGCDWSERLLLFSSHAGEFYREMLGGSVNSHDGRGPRPRKMDLLCEV